MHLRERDSLLQALKQFDSQLTSLQESVQRITKSKIEVESKYQRVKAELEQALRGRSNQPSPTQGQAAEADYGYEEAARKYRDENSRLHHEIQELRQKVTQMDRDSRADQAGFAELQRVYQNHCRLLEDQQQFLASVEADRDALVQELEDANIDLNRLQGKQIYRFLIDCLLLRSKAQYRQSVEEVERTKSERLRQRDEAESLQKELTLADHEITSLRRELEHSRKEKDYLQKQLSGIQRDFEVATEDIERITQENNILNKDIEALFDDKNYMAKDLEIEKSKVDDLVKQFEIRDSDYHKLYEQYKLGIKTIDNLELAVKESENAVASLKSQLANKLTETARYSDTKDNDYNKLLEQYKQALRRQEEMDRSIANAEAKVRQLEPTIADKEAELSRAYRDMSTVKDLNLRLGKSKEDLQHRNTEMKMEIDKLSASMNALKRDIDALQTQVKNEVLNVSTILETLAYTYQQTKKEKFEKLLNIERVSKAQLEVNRKQLMDSKTSLQEKVSIVEAEHAKQFAALVPELKMLEKDNARMTSELKAYESKQKLDNDSLTEREQQIVESKRKISELENMMENMRNEMEKIKALKASEKPSTVSNGYTRGVFVLNYFSKSAVPPSSDGQQSQQKYQNIEDELARTKAQLAQYEQIVAKQVEDANRHVENMLTTPDKHLDATLQTAPTEVHPGPLADGRKSTSPERRKRTGTEAEILAEGKHLLCL